MTADEAMALAKFQRPGIKLVVGPTQAREERMAPLRYEQKKKLPGPSSFLEYELGFAPTLWAMHYQWILRCVGYTLTPEDWKWLDHKSTSLVKANEWAEQIIEERLDELKKHIEEIKNGERSHRRTDEVGSS